MIRRRIILSLLVAGSIGMLTACQQSTQVLNADENTSEATDAGGLESGVNAIITTEVGKSAIIPEI